MLDGRLLGLVALSHGDEMGLDLPRTRQLSSALFPVPLTSVRSFDFGVGGDRIQLKKSQGGILAA